VSRGNNSVLPVIARKSRRENIMAFHLGSRRQAESIKAEEPKTEEPKTEEPKTEGGQ